jgi:type I restriction enzyme R subunit
LNRKLPKREKRIPNEIREAVDLDSFRIQETFTGGLPLTKTDSGISGIANGRPQHAEEEKDLLSNIINALNETYGLNLTDEDKVDIERIKIKLEENEELRAVMNENNTPENIRYKFDKVVDSILLGFVKQKWFDG